MIYFVRHGESEANERGVFAGQKEDSVLTEKGREQARSTAQAIKDKNITVDRIICSPLKRTRETAAIVVEEIAFPADQVVFDERITEYDMGSLTGTPIQSISSQALIAAQGAEDIIQFRDRVYACMKELSNSSENILIISSAGVGRILETIKQDMDPNLFYDLPAYPNASVHIIYWIK